MIDWLTKLWEERPPRYSRALLETLALIAYRQPITRGDIENVRGVSVSANITRTMLERGWIKVVGHRDVPGKPELFATTPQFLEYFGLKKLDDLPPLAEIADLDAVVPQLEFEIDESQPKLRVVDNDSESVSADLDDESEQNSEDDSETDDIADADVDDDDDFADDDDDDEQGWVESLDSTEKKLDTID